MQAPHVAVAPATGTAKATGSEAAWWGRGSRWRFIPLYFSRVCVCICVFRAGFEDPLLLVAAQAAAPDTYRLAPWTYTPSLALSFATEEEPMWYFGNGEGHAICL